MPLVILTGGPGAGKTTLLLELARRGFPTVSESAREVIAERLARGEKPRPEPRLFALELLRRDDEKHAASPQGNELVFFDRSAVESLAMVHETAPLQEALLRAKLATYCFHKTVFLLPPWEAIYKTDAERAHTFAHAARVHSQLLGWYRWSGYEINEVPCSPVAERATHVLQQIAGDA